MKMKQKFYLCFVVIFVSLEACEYALCLLYIEQGENYDVNLVQPLAAL